MRNMAAALLLSHGVPMVQMGDEYGHTKVSSAPSLYHILLHASILHQGWHCFALRWHGFVANLLYVRLA